MHLNQVCSKTVKSNDLRTYDLVQLGWSQQRCYLELHLDLLQLMNQLSHLHLLLQAYQDPASLATDETDAP